MEIPVITPPPNFGPEDHSTLATVAQAPGSKILDCTQIQSVPMNLCEIVAAGWAAPRGVVPRLAVVAQIDSWSLVRMLAPRAIAPLRAHGTELRLFYARQLAAGHVHRWVTDGTEPGHELAATLADLDQVWRGSVVAVNVVEAVLELIRADVTPARTSYLATLSSVALKFTEPARAVAIAREALEQIGGRTDDAARAAQITANATLAEASRR